MNQLFSPMSKDSFAWMDDLMVTHKEFKKALKLLENAIRIADENGLSLSPGKMNLFKKKFKYLGVEILRDKGARQISEVTIQGLLDMKPPIKYEELRKFLGKLNYDNGFIPGVAVAAYPMQVLVRKMSKEPFKWNKVLQESFLNVKAAIAESVILYEPYEDSQIHIWVKLFLEYKKFFDPNFFDLEL